MQLTLLEALWQEKLVNQELKRVFLDRNCDLWVCGTFKDRVDDYLAVTSRGVFAKVNGVFWQSEGQKHTPPLKLGFVACHLGFAQQDEFWEKHNVSAKDVPSLLVLSFKGHTEVHVKADDRLRLNTTLFPAAEARGILEFYVALLKYSQPEVGVPLKRFLDAVSDRNGYVEEGELE